MSTGTQGFGPYPAKIILDSFVSFYGLMISEGICKEFKSKQVDEWSMGRNRKLAVFIIRPNI